MPGTDVFAVAEEGVALRRAHDGKIARLELSADGKMLVRNASGKAAGPELLKDELGRE